MQGNKMGKLFIVTSGKGGTGKTMFAVNMAAVLAKKGDKVLLLDMNIGLRNVDLYLGKENDIIYDSSDIIRGVCDIEQAIVKDERFDGLYVLAAAPEHEDGVNIKKMSALIGALRMSFDYIIVDMPTGVSRITSDIAKDADRVILMSTPDYASIRNTDAMDRRLEELGCAKQKVVINRLVPEFMNAGVIPKLREMSKMMKSEIVGVIQEDKVISVSTNLGVPVILKDDTYIRKNFETITSKLTY